MPRRGPDQVNEHRLTLGTYERQLVEPIVGDLTRIARLGTYATVGVGAGAILAGSAVGLMAVYAYLNKEQAEEFLKEAWTAVSTGPPTIATSKPPPAPGTAPGIFDNRDPNDPMKRVNPAAGVPLIGPLFGLGMSIGEATVPDSWGLPDWMNL